MASFEPLIRMDENAFRAPDKMQPRISRKPPLSDMSNMTNSRKPLAKDQSSMKNINGFKGPEKSMAPPKVGRKPLGDLTNSNKPRAQEKSSKKNCVENVSAVNKEQAHSFALGEGFLHNHDECIKANKQSLTMSMDYFLETVALKRDSTPLTRPWLPQFSKALELEIETPMKIDEMEFYDISAPPSPLSMRSPGSPCWSTDLEDLEFSPLKLKESPLMNLSSRLQG